MMNNITNAQMTISDIDGNVYNTLTIGNQTWMKENLKVTHYCNGDLIPDINNTQIWASLTTGASCDCNYSPGNSAIYGKLYNFYTVTDSRKLCPIGWKVPTNAEWTELSNYLTSNGYGFHVGGNDIAKSMASTSGWLNYSTPGFVGNDQSSNNSSGFTALPAGYQSNYGVVPNNFSTTKWWSSSIFYMDIAYDRGLLFNSNILLSQSSDSNNGYSIRCLKNDNNGTQNLNIKEDFEIYFNSATDILCINLLNHTFLKNKQVFIYDTQGKLLLQQTITQQQTELNISQFAKGIYVVKVQNEKEIMQSKFIKE